MKPPLLLAHAFGQVYNLPVPLWLYLYGGAAAVLLSFLVIGFLVDATPEEKSSHPKQLRFNAALILKPLRVASASLFLVTILAGIFGSTESLQNFNVTFFWVIFLVGFTYVTAILGNLWELINPVRVILDWVQISAKTTIKPRFKYPNGLSYWPAMLQYFGLVWLELLSLGFGIVPLNLSRLIITYTLITLGGALAYGSDWFKYGDFFGVFFGLIAKIAPLQWQEHNVLLRPPVRGLLEDETSAPPVLIVFIVFMLASTAYDGFHETPSFTKLNSLITGLPLVSHLPAQLISIITLALAPLVFLAIYWAFIYLVKLVVGSSMTVTQLAGKFALTLVPIALAYNVAHYYTLLVIQGQLIIKLISDPLGLGWNLLGTAGYKINIGILNAATVWYSQVALIVVGHIAAVYVAHKVALKIFSSKKKAILSQYPLLVLMIIYTMTSLWIIAQPITKR